MLRYYLQHYLDFGNVWPFFLVCLIGLCVVLGIILVTARIAQQVTRRENPENYRRHLKAYHRDRPLHLVENFFEMVFSTTSVLLFLSMYYIVEVYLVSRSGAVANLWYHYQTPILLIFICLSVFLTGWFDVLLVPLRQLNADEKGAVRLVSSLYIILILLYIKFIYEDNNYDELIFYFVTLVIGRFLYFDFTWKWFFDTMKQVVVNLPQLVLMGIYTSITCWYGFHVQFLLKSNGVIVSTLIAHLFMCVAIFIIAHSHILNLFLRTPDPARVNLPPQQKAPRQESAPRRAYERQEPARERAAWKAAQSTAEKPSSAPVYPPQQKEEGPSADDLAYEQAAQEFSERMIHSNEDLRRAAETDTTKEPGDLTRAINDFRQE